VEELARLIRGKTAVEMQPFRNEGKAIVPAGASCCEIGSEKFKHRAEHRAHNETLALLPSFLQGHISIDSVISFLVANNRVTQIGVLE